MMLGESIDFELQVNIKKGDVFFADFGEVAENKSSSRQCGIRPCVVIQNNIGNKYSPMVIVAPITSKIKKQMSTHVFVRRGSVLKKDSVILLEQIQTIDKSKLISYAGHLTMRLIQKVDCSIRSSLDLDNKIKQDMCKLLQDVSEQDYFLCRYINICVERNISLKDIKKDIEEYESRYKAYMTKAKEYGIQSKKYEPQFRKVLDDVIKKLKE